MQNTVSIRQQKNQPPFEPATNTAPSARRGWGVATRKPSTRRLGRPKQTRFDVFRPPYQKLLLCDSAGILDADDALGPRAKSIAFPALSIVTPYPEKPCYARQGFGGLARPRSSRDQTSSELSLTTPTRYAPCQGLCRRQV